MPKIAKDFVISRILTYANDHLSQKQMQKNLNIKRTTLEYQLKGLVNLGYLTKIPHTKPCFYEITEPGKQYLQALMTKAHTGYIKPLIQLHNFSVEMPLVADKSQSFWEKSWQVNKWVKSFKDLQDVGVSVEKSHKTLTINFKPQEIRQENILPMIFNGTFYVAGLLAKEGIELDLMGMRVSRQEYALPTPLAEPIIEKGMTIQADLGHPAAIIMPKDIPKPAKAWVDASKGLPEIDTNDFSYAERLLKMPERVEWIERTIQGSLSTLQALANTQALMAAGWKLSQEKIVRTEKRIRNLEQKRIKEFL